MLEKLILSDEDYDHLAKGIALGAGIGILLGIFINDVILAFSACTIVGIVFSLGHSLYKKFKHQ